MENVEHKELLNHGALGRRIRFLRGIMNLSQGEVSERIGISVSCLSHIERGSRKPSMEMVLLIARALNTTPDDLMRDSIYWTEPNPYAPQIIVEPYTMSECIKMMRIVAEKLEIMTK